MHNRISSLLVLSQAGMMVLLCGLAVACNAEPKEEMIPVTLTGIDHLPGHLSVQSFSVDGHGGGQAGRGGSQLCCVSLPAHWRPDLRVRVVWGVTNWPKCEADEYRTEVAVERYDEVGNMYVHFLPDGSVRVVSSNYYPEGAGQPESKYPVKAIIPDKNPWHQYPLEETCKDKDREAPPTRHREGEVSYE